MENNSLETDGRDQLRKRLAEFDTAMLVTCRNNHPSRARPMALAKAGLAGGIHQNDDLYFVTDSESPKVDELHKNPNVVVTFANRSEFISVSGTVTVTQDKLLIRALWSEAWKVWFPQGVDDPSLCILQVTPTEAEYWDNAGLKGLRYMFEAAKSYLKGVKMDQSDDDDERHKKVRL